jgi:hypothetical protein
MEQGQYQQWTQRRLMKEQNQQFGI